MTISSNADSPELVLHVPSEYDYFYATPRRNEIVDLLRKLYFKQHAKSLPLYAVPVLHLAQFAANGGYAKRMPYTIPEEHFRVAEENGKSVRSEEVSKSMEPCEEGKSKTIYQRLSGEKPVSLADFKAIKKIGKGSFGTVR